MIVLPLTYEPIATTTVGPGGAVSISFTSISSSYTDLRIVLVGSTTTGGDTLRMRFNGDTGTNYSGTWIEGNGSAASSTRYTSSGAQGTGITPTTTNAYQTTQPALTILDIFNYAGSTFKTVLSSTLSDRNGTGTVTNSVNMWRSTSAITSISLTFYAGDAFEWKTVATLYGILKA